MYTITFYSYKGGVGRTMALVNVAAELTRRGRKVLIVDFDLEAPGISCFKQFSTAEKRAGLVEYVTQYIETAISPCASDYIVEAELPVEGGFQPVWVFPAGANDVGYGAKLSAIDWQLLYERQSGYLFFEDFKQQIESDSRRFDYVLIDSRTGHTDVGGICTRQLADAVALMYFPNAQNISGMEAIVDDIRKSSSEYSRRPDLVFCPSNVPDLDDEDGVLKKMLDEAKSRLKYEKPQCIVRHYNSLSLVDQSIFVIDRPNTKLAKEYRQLTAALVRNNFEDRDGALLALADVRKKLEARNRSNTDNLRPADMPSLSSLTEILEKVSLKHRHDGEISWQVAASYNSLGSLSNELEALNNVLEIGYNVHRALLRRAFNLLSQSRPDEARVDLVATIASPECTVIELRSAIEALKTIDKDWVNVVKSAPSLQKLRPGDVTILTQVLMSDVRALAIANDIISSAIDRSSEEHRDSLLSEELVLVLIACGRFSDAMTALSNGQRSMSDSDSIADVFNYAMAEWGETGIPPRHLLQRVLELNDANGRPTEANYLQCMALSAGALAQFDLARSFVSKARSAVARGTVFSCWTYLFRGRNAMLEDLEQMNSSFQNGLCAPPFLARKITFSSSAYN